MFYDSPAFPWSEIYSAQPPLTWELVSAPLTCTTVWSFPSSIVSSWMQCPQSRALFIQYKELLKTGKNKWSTWKYHTLSFMSRVNFFGFQSPWGEHSRRVLVGSWASWISCLDLWVGLAETACARPGADKWCAQSLLCCYWCLRLSGTN